jgi:hypothetical protein
VTNRGQYSVFAILSEIRACNDRSVTSLRMEFPEGTLDVTRTIAKTLEKMGYRTAILDDGLLMKPKLTISWGHWRIAKPRQAV